MPYKLADIADQRFGKLIALQYAGKGAWLCKCDCGRMTTVITSNLTRGNTRSCGCQLHPSKHGMATSKIYGVWQSMRSRCGNPNDQAFANYGGRGITVCERWEDFALFLQDMGPRPDGYQIDRIDNDKGYSPENCHWVRPRDNLRNKRTSHKVEWRGESRTISEWAEIRGIHQRTLFNRIGRGWTIEKAMTHPVSKKERLN